MRRILTAIILFVTSCLAFSADRTVQYLTGPTFTASSFTDRELVMNVPCDLHLTATPRPLINSLVQLNTPDSWLFLDNMRPKLAIDSILKYVQVNGAAAVNKSNVRVAIYRNGAIVMPHPPTIKPLTVFTGTNCTGDSASYSLYVRNTSLGTTFNNAIRSFRLKRGYMATLATNADGTGYSRVFIADQADQVFNVLPSELDRMISFIRVYNWEYTSKKGWCGGAGDCETVDGTWFYGWNASESSTAGIEYVPMRPKLHWPSWTEINGKQGVTHLLGLNEPDHPEQHKDDNGGNAVTVAQALAQWPDMLRSGLRLGAPACTNFSWLYSFMDSCKAHNYRVDYVGVHAYWGGKSPANWYNDLKYIHERTGLPLWITEWNNGANWTTEWWPTDQQECFTKQYNDIKAILNVLDTAHFVERYSIYNWVEDKRAMILNGNLTLAGAYYKSNKSDIAFKRVNEVIPTWTMAKIAMGISANNGVATLAVVDPNGEFFRGFVMEKKTGDGAWTFFRESDNLTQKITTDTLDLSVPGSIRYRVRSKRPDGTLSEYSNETGLDISNGTTIQYGQAGINNLGWNPILFNQPFVSIPAVITGGVTYKNSAALLTTRAKLVSFTSSFNLQMIPWSYQKITSVSKEETIPYLACPTGQHQFGDLTAQAGISSVSFSVWTPVSFPTAFDTVPIVFTTQLSPQTSYATTVRVRNVTKTGFEARIQKETALKGSPSPESVSYFAIIPGTGLIGNKKVRTGFTNPNAIGYILCSIPYGDSIPNPLFLAQMQTCNDDTTAVLRTTSISAKSATVLKQREKSTGATYMKPETGGWLVIDLDSDLSSVPKEKKPSLHLYPNPATELIQLGCSFHDGIQVSVYDVHGRLRINSMVYGDQLRIADLEPGCYVMRSPAFGTVKFIKQ